MNKNIWLTILLTIILYLFIDLFMVSKTCADYKNSCNSPTPIVSITPTIPLESPTMTVAPTQITTPNYITATPSIAVSSGGVGNIPNNPHTNTTSAPGSLTCNITFSPPVLTSITAGQSGQLTLNWLESSPVDKFSIIYGLVGQPMNWGEDNIPSTSRSLPINGLPIGSYINAQIWAWQNGCPQKSEILDPLVL